MNTTESIEQAEAPTEHTVTSVARDFGVDETGLRLRVQRRLPDFGHWFEGTGERMFDPESWSWKVILTPAHRALKEWEVAVVQEEARLQRCNSARRPGRCRTVGFAR